MLLFFVRIELKTFSGKGNDLCTILSGNAQILLKETLGSKQCDTQVENSLSKRPESQKVSVKSVK